MSRCSFSEVAHDWAQQTRKDVWHTEEHKPGTLTSGSMLCSNEYSKQQTRVCDKGSVLVSLQYLL